MMKDVIDLGESTKFDIEDEYYKKFCNQLENEGTDARSRRTVFKTDWQRFLWAFILGIYVGDKTPLRDKTKNPPFGMEIFKNRNKILKTMIALTLQELYKDNPDELKKDFETATENGENLGRKIKVAIEEYANTGFSILDRRGRERPGYIENIEYVVEDILSDRNSSW